MQNAACVQQESHWEKHPCFSKNAFFPVVRIGLIGMWQAVNLVACATLDVYSLVTSDTMHRISTFFILPCY